MSAVESELIALRDIARRVQQPPSERDAESERKLHELLQNLPAATYTTDAAGRITFYNEAAVAFWGCRPTLNSDQWCGSWRLYWPDGTPMPHDQCPMAIALKERRAINGQEAVAERPDGTRVLFMAFPSPLSDESGAVGSSSLEPRAWRSSRSASIRWCSWRRSSETSRSRATVAAVAKP